MRQSARIALLLLTGCGIALAGEPRSPVDWVNPYIGTGGSDNGPDYGGMAPLVVASLIARTGDPLAPVYYVSACSAIGLVAALAFPARQIVQALADRSGA